MLPLTDACLPSSPKPPQVCADNRSMQEVVLSDGGSGFFALCAGLVPRRPLAGSWTPWAICIMSRVIDGDDPVSVGGLQDGILDEGGRGRLAPCESPASPSPLPPGPQVPRDICRRFNALACESP